ncbi:MAG: hypothetical protein QM749_14315 [Aquabacterium sp.]
MTHPRRQPHSGCMAVVLAAGLLTQGASAWAMDVVMSGFGTLGYAISDKSYHYQRFIDDGGTFKRDTVLGAQADVKLAPQWSATGQVMVAPSLGNDDDWSLTTAWAFLSWRPSNDWLLRLGKQRVPLYLNAENRAVGQTYDFARLPVEVYSISPSTDLTGLYVSRTWSPELGEVTLDTFAGGAGLKARAYSRDAGAVFLPVHTDVIGAALTLRMEASTWRASYHHTTTRLIGGQGLPSHYPYVAAAGYYQVDDRQFGPGVAYAPHIVNDVIILSGDIEVLPRWRVVSELARNIQMRTENGANTAGGYVAVLHKMGGFTPYVSYARLRSMGASVDVVRQLDASVLPNGVLSPEDTARLNMSQRFAADIVQVYDQDTFALGTSFALTPQSKLKAEWARTRIGNRSAMVDSPMGGDVVRRERINVLSLNYSFAY